MSPPEQNARGFRGPPSPGWRLKGAAAARTSPPEAGGPALLSAKARAARPPSPGWSSRVTEPRPPDTRSRHPPNGLASGVLAWDFLAFSLQVERPSAALDTRGVSRQRGCTGRPGQASPESPAPVPAPAQGLLQRHAGGHVRAAASGAGFAPGWRVWGREEAGAHRHVLRRPGPPKTTGKGRGQTSPLNALAERWQCVSGGCPGPGSPDRGEARGFVTSSCVWVLLCQRGDACRWGTPTATSGMSPGDARDPRGRP